MGTRQFTWQTNLDYENTYKKIQELGLIPKPQLIGRKAERLGGNITFKLPQYNIKIQISPKGTVNIWLPNEASLLYNPIFEYELLTGDFIMSEPLATIMKIVKPFCVKENGDLCEWEHPKVIAGPTALRETIERLKEYVREVRRKRSRLVLSKRKI